MLRSFILSLIIASSLLAQKPSFTVGWSIYAGWTPYYYLQKSGILKKWADLGGYTCSQAVLKSEAFQKATPYNKAFYDTMFMVKDFWATPEYAEVLDQLNQNIYPFVVGGKGTAQEALDKTAADWKATFTKYNRYK